MFMDRFQFKVLIVLCLLLAFFMGCAREERIDSRQNEPAANSEYSHSFGK